MTLAELRADVASSLKKGDTVRVGTLRFLLSAIQNTAIAKYGNRGESALVETDILDVIKKQIKTHKESIDMFEKAGRKELVEKEKAELAILLSFAPQELTEEEIKAELAPIVATGETHFGILMKQAMEKVAGRADGARVAGVLRTMIAS